MYVVHSVVKSIFYSIRVTVHSVGEHTFLPVTKTRKPTYAEIVSKKGTEEQVEKKDQEQVTKLNRQSKIDRAKHTAHNIY